MNEEQRKMMELWSELQRIRKQCSEYREQTERDLENQRNEFIKVIRHVSGLVRGFNAEVIYIQMKNDFMLKFKVKVNLLHKQVV